MHLFFCCLGFKHTQKGVCSYSCSLTLNTASDTHSHTDQHAMSDAEHVVLGQASYHQSCRCGCQRKQGRSGSRSLFDSAYSVPAWSWLGTGMAPKCPFTWLQCMTFCTILLARSQLSICATMTSYSARMHDVFLAAACSRCTCSTLL